MDTPETLITRLEAVLAQLRHAYAQLKDGSAENWTQRRRMMFADGLIAPQIRKLELAAHALSGATPAEQDDLQWLASIGDKLAVARLRKAALTPVSATAPSLHTCVEDDDICGGCERDKRLEAVSPTAPEQAPSIDCPACGETVKQVASATLSLALWQHWNWTCPKREASVSTASEGEKRLARYIASHRTYQHIGSESHDKALDDQLRALEQALAYVEGKDEYLNILVESRLAPPASAGTDK